MSKSNKNRFKGLVFSLKGVLPKALKTAWWMIRIMLPVSFAVMIMQYFGLLQYISHFLTPAFQYIGLPGESALVYITSIFLSIYGAIAVIGTLSLDLREITILAIMCLIAHNMIIETAIQKRTGSSAIRIVIFRIIWSFIAAYLFNLFLPNDIFSKGHFTESHQFSSILSMIEVWFKGSVLLSFKVICLVTGLLFLQKILEELGAMQLLSKIFMPFMKPMGLPENTSFHWIIANLVGLTYGSAIMFDQVDSGKLKLKDADLLNHHIAINHSLLEDTLLFVAIGVSALWITFPRIALAMLAVWIYKFELFFKKYISAKPNSTPL
jgi:hypothetical protein